MSAALTRRIGQVFTLGELAACYETADRWVLEAIHDAFPDGASSEAATVADAAFAAPRAAPPTTRHERALLALHGRRRRRRGKLRVLIAPLAVAVAFVGGVGLGEALHDNPNAGGTQTLVRTLRPLPLAPIDRHTVTVTTSTST